MVKNVRGWNCDEDADRILTELEIPEKNFSKTINKIIKEWHNFSKEPMPVESYLEIKRVRV